MIRLTVGLAALTLAVGTFTAACSSSDREGDDGAEGELRRRADDAWFYDGPLPALQDAKVVVSIKGHTARVSGYVSPDVDISGLPHVQATPEGDRVHLDVVYPIATAKPGKSNSPPGVYPFHLAKPYRPDGIAVTREEGEHWVPWGGYPFVAYNGGIAFHGPITSSGAETPAPEDDIWYLMRGPVSGGCNRMAAEHIIEFTHIVGISMRKVYEPNKAYTPRTSTKVEVIADYDMIGEKFVDVDYPTASGMTRPATEHGAENVNMFGSWVASETPDGRDLPPSMKWEGGVPGKYYVFREHVRQNMVCAAPATELARVKELAARTGGELPRGFCNGRVRPPTRPGGNTGGGGNTPPAEQKPER